MCLNYRGLLLYNGTLTHLYPQRVPGVGRVDEALVEKELRVAPSTVEYPQLLPSLDRVRREAVTCAQLSVEVC